jgi:uncharacterized cupin superfamily protein
MRRANVFTAAATYDDEDPAPYHSGVVHLAKALGAQTLSVNVLELPPGQSFCPYHYEYEEEWLIVLTGSVTVRVPDGEHELAAGDAVCFPPGPDGAHKVTNTSSEPSRAVMFSSAREPAVAVYPDSDKIGVWPGNKDDHVMLRRADGHVPYFDGET